MSVNKATLIGNLGRDPELKFTPAGDAVCNFPMATTEKWTDKSGQKQEKTEWHNIVAWNNQAEVLNKYLTKGSKVYIEGKIETQSWDVAGEKRYKTIIRVTGFDLINSRNQSEQVLQSQPEEKIDDEDLPF
jgi:single-strand DNA-binding protein